MRGLSQELRTNTLAYQYLTSDELYEDFLSAFDSYQIDLMNIIKYRTILLGNLDRIQLPVEKVQKLISYKKNRQFAIANRNLPDKRTFFRCGKLGHVARCVPYS